MINGLIVIPIMIFQAVIGLGKAIRHFTWETFRPSDQAARIEEMKNRRIQTEIQKREGDE